MATINREERLARTMSMAQNKGLLNNPGENNCFLNSAVQVFWHLDVFRRSFREIKGHYCMGKSCIFCALQYIFKEFQYSSNDALPPDTLRLAMAGTFRDQRKFQLGDMDDAAECFENILQRMHFHLAMNEHDDGCNAKHCISHQKFAMQMIEQTICPCGERSEPLPFFEFVHYVSASALCSQARIIEKHLDEEYDPMRHFGTLLRMTGEDKRNCPSPECDERIRVQRLLLNYPDIVSIGLNWDSESPDIYHISEVLDSIGTTLRLQYLFHQVCDEEAAKTKLRLVGLVTYYGKHYSTFFYHSKLETWIYFDDARVREIGRDWSVIRDKCRRCHYQPLLLLYANPNGQPVSTKTAPQEKINANGATLRTPSSKRLSTEGLSRTHDTDRPRRRKSESRSSSAERDMDSESNMSTLQSHSNTLTNGYTKDNGSDDTLKAYDSPSSKRSERHGHATHDDRDTTFRAHDSNGRDEYGHATQSDSEDTTLKARDSARRKHEGHFKSDKIRISTRRSKSCDALDENSSSRASRRKIALHRTSSAGSDVTEKAKRKKHGSTGSTKDRPKKTGLRRIGSAIFNAMKPTVVISGVKMPKPKKRASVKDRRPSDASTEMSGEPELLVLNPEHLTTKEDILKFYEQANIKSDDYLRSPSHDSGIGSATGSVSSTDTNQGGSDEDLIDYSLTLHSMRTGAHNGRGTTRDNSMSRYREKCELFLNEADSIMTQSQNAENANDLKAALKYCTEAVVLFSQAAELPGVSHNNIMYANKKRDLSQERCQTLRKKLEARNSDRSTRVSKSDEDDLLRQQRIRDDMILRQQQQNLQQYGTLPRKLPTYKDIYTPSVTTNNEEIIPTTDPVRQHHTEYYPANDTTVSTLPPKPKRTSSHNYVARMRDTHGRSWDPVCTQKIKPDSMCYSPSHYEQDEVVSKMQGLSVRPQPVAQYGSSPSERRVSYEAPRSYASSRESRMDSEMERERSRPPERKVSSASIYLSQPKAGYSGSYDSSRYRDGEPRRQSKVYYAGAADSTLYRPDQELRSHSYNNMDTTSSSSSSSGRVPSSIPYEHRPPSYRPSPPSYQAVQQSREGLRSRSASALHQPWYRDDTSSISEHCRSEPDPKNLKAMSARIIADRPVCVRCQRVQVARHQRMCAGCEDELRRKHAPDRTAMYY